MDHGVVEFVSLLAIYISLARAMLKVRALSSLVSLSSVVYLYYTHTTRDYSRRDVLYKPRDMLHCSTLELRSYSEIVHQ